MPSTASLRSHCLTSRPLLLSDGGLKWEPTLWTECQDELSQGQNLHKRLPEPLYRLRWGMLGSSSMLKAYTLCPTLGK